MKNKIDWSLYLCTDRELTGEKNFETCVEDAIKGGVTVVQLREKNLSGKKFFETALSLKKITGKYKIPLIINDRVDIAVAADADGVHVGQSDLPAKAARKIIGEEKILGVSASTLDEALKAESDGADYIGVGGIFFTATKPDAEFVSPETLKKICESVKIPVVAIGGINAETLPQVKGTGIAGVAVVSAIVAAENPEDAAKNLLSIWRN